MSTVTPTVIPSPALTFAAAIGARPDHGGATFEGALDRDRLNAQTRRVFDLMRDGAWRTLREIAGATNDPEASVSARLRDLRKSAFGGFTVERRRRGEASRGLWEYRLLPPVPPAPGATATAPTAEPKPEPPTQGEPPPCGPAT